MKKIDFSLIPYSRGCGYPAPFDVACQERVRQQLGDFAGLTDFGVNLLQLPPGVWSSQRHWHAAEDEFIWVLQGEVVLVTDSGAEVMGTGACAGFKAGAADGHHLQNRSDKPAIVLEVGARRANDVVEYSDIDLIAGPGGFTRKDASVY